MQNQTRGDAGYERAEQDGEGDESKQLALAGKVDPAAQSKCDTEYGDGGFTDIAGG
jgi:hypothetical protein